MKMRNHPSMRRLLLIVSLCAAAALAEEMPRSVTPAIQTAEWAAAWWKPRHEKKVEEAKERGDKIKLLMIGDSITHGWENGGKHLWESYYADRGAFNLGFGGDCTEQVLWRLQHGEVDGLHPDLAVLLIGTNNTGIHDDPAKDTAMGVEAIIKELRTRLPQMKILLLAIFPRGATSDDPKRRVNEQVNALIEKYADHRSVYFLNINKSFLHDDGTLTERIMPDLLHPSPEGYAIWAGAMEPTIKRLLGELN
ncbi:MAG: acetylglucosamine-6-sulfatase [Planctomycetes bacterium]|nr:acetylglucosamine-6-sulfatase [Planctomycetota bacterium]